MDTAQWPQEVVVNPMEEIIPKNTNAVSTSKPSSVERKISPQKDQTLNCPRCNSTNTKFCYYNNYSLSQPRYFCKTCRRYWTAGGSLRKIPVGGASRKVKNSSSSNKLPDLVLPPPPPQQNPPNEERQDLNLDFSSDFKTISELIQVPNSFMPMPISDPINSVYSASFSLPEFKPSLNFSLDHGLGSGGGYEDHVQQDSTTSGRLLFPFEDLKLQVSSTTAEQNRDGESSGYWSAV